MMVYQTEIANNARDISLDKLLQTYMQKDMEVLKEAIDMHQMVQQEIANLINQVMPHLGANIDLLA